MHSEESFWQATSILTPFAWQFSEAFAFRAKMLPQLPAANVGANRSGQKQNQEGEAFAQIEMSQQTLPICPSFASVELNKLPSNSVSRWRHSNLLRRWQLGQSRHFLPDQRVEVVPILPIRQIKDEVSVEKAAEASDALRLRVG